MARLAKINARPYLDVQVCDHCNLRCAGCLHFAPLAERRFLDLDEYREDLARLAAIEGIEGFFDSIVLMGGEPLLHPCVSEVVRTTRAYLPSEDMSLCTNGLLLRRMSDDLWDALRECNAELYISPYPIAIDYDDLLALAHARGVRAFFADDVTEVAGGKEAFVRLALDPRGECDPTRSFASCPFGGCHMQLAHGAVWPCQVSAHHGLFARRFGYDMHDSPDDALLLESIVSAGQIEDFRRRPHSMCRYCNNEALTVAPWERSALDAGEWLAGA